jgi:hypothetical protein
MDSFQIPIGSWIRPISLMARTKSGDPVPYPSFSSVIMSARFRSSSISRPWLFCWDAWTFSSFVC